MQNSLTNPDFNFIHQTNFYKGKVRNVYTIHEDLMVMIATDRLSAFDVVLPQGIPHKGQILNQLAIYMLESTKHLVPNWLLASPHPNVSIGHQCIPFKIEMVVRGYLSGHAAREYKAGKRMLCGEKLPEGLREHDRLPTPIITPTTKANQGEHDLDISKKEILENKIVSKEDYELLEKYSLQLFEFGSKLALEKGLLLVDTKYEFGKTKDGKIVIIDEIHTPDSSRYFYANTYEEYQDKGIKQRQLSKEFVREWLITQGFQGKKDQKIPNLPKKFVDMVTNRYIELFEKITDKKYVPESYTQRNQDIRIAVNDFIAKSK